jgi:hypothetical protein
MHILDQVHLSKSTLAYHFHDYEILQLHSVALLLSLEDQLPTLLHALPCSRLLDPDLILTVLIFVFLIIVVIVLVLVCEILALLELLVSDFNVLLKIVKLIGGIINSDTTGGTGRSTGFSLHNNGIFRFQSILWGWEARC